MVMRRSSSERSFKDKEEDEDVIIALDYTRCHR